MFLSYNRLLIILSQIFLESQYRKQRKLLIIQYFLRRSATTRQKDDETDTICIILHPPIDTINHRLSEQPHKREGAHVRREHVDQRNGGRKEAGVRTLRERNDIEGRHTCKISGIDTNEEDGSHPRSITNTSALQHAR